MKILLFVMAAATALTVNGDDSLSTGFKDALATYDAAKSAADACKPDADCTEVSARLEAAAAAVKVWARKATEEVSRLNEQIASAKSTADRDAATDRLSAFSTLLKKAGSPTRVSEGTPPLTSVEPEEADRLIDQVIGLDAEVAVCASELHETYIQCNTTCTAEQKGLRYVKCDGASCAGSQYEECDAVCQARSHGPFFSKCDEGCRAERRRSCRMARVELAQLEAKVFNNVLTDRDLLAKGRQKLTATGLTDQQTRKIQQSNKVIEDRIQRVQRFLVLPTETDLYQTLADFRRFEARYYLGIEFAGLNQTFKKGFPRIGTYIQWRYGGLTVPEHYPESGHTWRYGVYHTFSAALTNTAESLAPDAKATAEPKQTFEFETELYAPLLRTSIVDRRLRNYTGIVLSFGARKTDDTVQVDDRRYIGIRSAMTPEHYYEALYGKTKSLRSRRLEVRGQIPVRRFSESSRLLLGAAGNFGLDKRRADGRSGSGKEPDVIRIYVSYNADFSKIFGAAFGN
jgi:hypothetical protein